LVDGRALEIFADAIDRRVSATGTARPDTKPICTMLA
jgi:hypothetical protein